MSPRGSKPEASELPELDRMIADAKGTRTPDVDWAKVEAKLFPRVEREAQAQAALGAYVGHGKTRAWIAATVVLAAAAAVPMFLTPRAPVRPLDEVVATREPSAGTLFEKDRNASLHLTRGGGTPRDLASGDAIARGDMLDAHGGKGVFQRTEPSGVTWALEDSSQVEVRAARGTLILALAKGAVEAQVTPVAEGEAFAVDVEGTRVAVHGTHLRVEKQGTRAVVDLREGVISIGVPPKSGSTYGDLVTAPAHVEFEVADPHGTLKVSHEPGRVRAPLTLASPDVHKPAPKLPPPSGPVTLAPPAVTSPPSVSPSNPLVGTGGSGAVSKISGRAAPSGATGAIAPVAAVTAGPAIVASASTLPASAPAEPMASGQAAPSVDPNAERTVVDQVRACARKHVEHSDGVVITVSSKLELRVSDSGMVSSAIFDPPLAPEVQACASSAIYGTRFAKPGAVVVSIEITP